MKYKKSELEKLALKAIKKHNLIYIEEVCSFLPCSRATFYNHSLDKLDSIKDAINGIRISKKTYLRNKWEDSDNATLNVALYKLLSNEDELNRLNNNEVSKNEKRKQIVLTPKKEDEE